MPRFALAFLALPMLTGCATMAAYLEEARQYQALADPATHALGGGEMPGNVVAGNVGGSGSASCRQGTISIGRDCGNVRWLLAHERRHHISGHCGEGLPAPSLLKPADVGTDAGNQLASLRTST